METKSIGPSTEINNSPITVVDPPHSGPFVHALLHIQKILDSLFKTVQHTENTETFSTGLFPSTSPFDPGTFHFGAFLYAIERLKEKGEFLSTIKERREELLHQKEHWRAFVQQLQSGKDQPFYNAIENVLKQGKLITETSGCGSAYFLTDAEGIPRYVVKPVDEDICCLNNRKEYGSLFIDVDHRVREEIPLYRSAQTDTFCWEIARVAKLEGATPKTVMGIIQSEQFYDFTLWIPDTDKEEFIDKTGFPDKEKLCSIQEFIPDAQDLSELLHTFYAQNLSDEEIRKRFDPSDIEQVFLLLWLSYDSDAHGGNFCTYVKKIDETG
jgi:hypothetical protein